MGKLGRRRQKKLRRIAFMVDCLDDFCGNCDRLWIEKRDDGIVAFCHILRCGLEYVGGYKGAYRCSDCHMAERCGNGEDIRR